MNRSLCSVLSSARHAEEGAILSKSLSPLSVWALAFGCAVGWGAFVMPGTTFLPIAGPVGSLLGLLIGAAVMFLIGMNYHYLMNRYPSVGGAYTFAGQVLGSDHGFLCAWLLILTYIAVLWANATALALIVRYLFGDLFCFGFSYSIAGYTVYFGELLLPFAVIAVAFAVCVIGRRVTGAVQTVFALLLIAGIIVCFVGVCANGGFRGFSPAFSSDGSGASQVFAIVILAPWAFIGFESVSHSTAEFRFSPKKSLLIMAVALITGVLAYGLLTVCAASAVPQGFADWQDYVARLGSFTGVEGLPVFYAARTAMGSTGLILVGFAALGGIMTGVIATMNAVSRLLFSMAQDGMMIPQLGKLGKHRTPVYALALIAAVSCVMPFFGRTAISWIVDVTTIGATIVYAYVSITAFVAGRRDKDKKPMITGIVGFLVSAVFVLVFIMPNLVSQSKLATESYFILVTWSIVGIMVFRLLMQYDREHRIGQSEVSWLVLFFLILVISTVWLLDATSEQAAGLTADITARSALAAQGDLGGFVVERTGAFERAVAGNVLIFVILITVSFLIIHSIFLVIRRRQQQAEIEKTRAEEGSKAKSLFLSNMSHDIRTPLNAITGYTALALQKSDLPHGTREYLEKIDFSSKHLLSLINDILDMSRIENGKMEIEAAPADLIRLMDEVYDIFLMQMQAKKLTFTVDRSDVTDRYAVFDKNRLNRVLLNLISNALKFTPENGSITVTLRQTGAEEDCAAYELRVKDNGIGMSQAFAEHVFEAFERERSKTINQIQGTGLGMAITKSFVDMMHGTIRVETEQGKGTEFIIDLSFPKATAAEIAALEKESDADDRAVDFTGTNVLLVEDNPINKEIATMLLEQAGFRVTYAENGKVALDTVAASEPGRFDAVLMDVQMPVMNGYDATRAIRALDPARAGVPIIAMSANAFAEDVKEALEAGMNAHVAKPINVDVMMETLARVLHK